jgi:hypothetical protein
VQKHVMASSTPLQQRHIVIDKTWKLRILGKTLMLQLQDCNMS